MRVSSDMLYSLKVKRVDYETARHLPLADKIIVLTSDGEIDQQGSYQQLRSSEGFVKSVSAQDRAFEGGETPQDSVSLARKVGQGPTPEQVYDLTRRTGDMSVYKYYFMTIKKSSVAIFLATNVVYAFCYGFLRKHPMLGLENDTDKTRGLAATIH